MAENTDVIIKELHLEASRLLAQKCDDETIVNVHLYRIPIHARYNR